jgi:cell division transport system ATP-binding protein
MEEVQRQLIPLYRNDLGAAAGFGAPLGEASGEMIYLLGKVGSGKSSLMKTIYGALPIAAGEARVLDYDIVHIRRRKLPYLRRRLGIIFQDYKLLTDRSVEENLLFVLRATGWKNKQLMHDHVFEVLKQVGMETKAYKKPHELSGGEQQRVVIARALLNTPEIILADEPTGNLDGETGREIMDLLYSISQAGITVLMSTHNINWPELYPGRKWLFENGEIHQ